MPEPADPRAVLQQVFGFDAFRPGQEEIVRAALAGRDVLAIMPTGGGKSLCFQLPALLRDGLTVVVSPLIALMRDQVAQLRDYGIAAAALNSANGPEANAETLRDAREGRLKLLYVSPERLAQPGTLAALRGASVGLLAVDEAHCVSQWGHDFRPEYRLIGEIRAELGGVQTLAFTATADELTRADIAERLFAEPPEIFLRGFDRPNIHLAMRPRDNARRQLVEFLGRHKGENGIVYCLSRKRVEETAAFLAAEGWRAVAYHAGLEAGERARAQDLFVQEDGIVVVATVAFGMGVDKPDVRFVFHLDLPKNIEGYYQEIGRAGRDGLPAEAMALYGMGEVRQYRQWIEESEAPDEQKRIERQKLSALVALCEAPRCRRVSLLGYFGEQAEPCGRCDLCDGGIETFDGTELAQKALSAIVRTRELFGMEHLISVLRGEVTEMVTKHRHDELPTFGVGAEHSRKAWRAIYRQLYAAGLANMDMARFGRWTVTEAGWQVLRGQAQVALRQDALAAADATGGRRRKAPRPELDDLAARADAGLLAALKDLRRRLAKEKGVPAYVVFSDRTLLEMAAAAPHDLEGLGRLHGVGEKKLERYGESFLEVIRRTGMDAA